MTMWWASIRDMQWRRRRFMIGIAGAAVVFAMALLLSGLSAGFRAEPRRTFEGVGGDGWVMEKGATGPVTSVSPLPADVVDAVRSTPGITRADGLVMSRVAVSSTRRMVMLFGHAPGGVGVPPVVEGRAAARAGEAVVDRSLDADIGDTVVFCGQALRVVGHTSGRTLLSGNPDVFVTIDQARSIAFNGLPLVNAIVFEGRPTAPLPPGTRLLSMSEVIADGLEPMIKPIQAVDVIRNLLWLVAAIIIGSIVYLTALERMRDFAVLKAVGASSSSLAGGLALQAVVLSMVAAVLAAILATLLEPLFPLPVVISRLALLSLPAVAIFVGVIASLAGLRRVTAADPVAAFGSA
jgi:putative ABC transport system permease protein